jgi:hypothetical protein
MVNFLLGAGGGALAFFSCEDLPAALGQCLLAGLGCPQQGWRNGAGSNGAVVDARAQHASPAEPAKGGLTYSQDLHGFLRGGGKSHWGLSNVLTGSVGHCSFPGALDCQHFPMKEGGAAFLVWRQCLLVAGQAEARTFAQSGFSASEQSFPQPEAWRSR